MFEWVEFFFNWLTSFLSYRSLKFSRVDFRYFQLHLSVVLILRLVRLRITEQPVFNGIRGIIQDWSFCKIPASNDILFRIVYKSKQRPDTSSWKEENFDLSMVVDTCADVWVFLGSKSVTNCYDNDLCESAAAESSRGATNFWKTNCERCDSSKTNPWTSLQSHSKNISSYVWVIIDVGKFVDVD